MEKIKDIKQILFDADDTLWENNIYYVRASSDFFDLIVRGGFTIMEIERDFDELELQVVRERGYGSHNFVYILEELYRRYQEKGLKADDEKFKEIIRRFVDHPVTPPLLFDGVAETLTYLKDKYSLFILTKGEYEEQKGKICRSGLRDLVNDFFIVPEKDDKAYSVLLQEHGWQAGKTCMVGNSPKSDINPALRLGMYAIHIPYRDTWKLDDEPIQSVNSRLIVLPQFKDLQKIF